MRAAGPAQRAGPAFLTEDAVKRAMRQNLGIIFIGVGIVAAYWLQTDGYGVEKMFRVILPAAAPTLFAGCSIA